MGFVVMNIRKSKGGGSSALGQHIDRVQGKEHMYRNADESRRNFNKSFKTDYTGSIDERVAKCIEQNYKGKKAIRKDAVKYLSLVLTGSHSDMVRIFSNPKTKFEWLKQNSEFLKEEFGSHNIVKVDLHLDERTPHLHVILCPITRDGRLSAKEVYGNKKKMRERLTRYANRMQSLGLERGQRMEKAKAKDINQFYNLVSETQKVQNMDFLSVKKISPRHKTEIIKKLLKGDKMAQKIDDFNKRKGISR